MALRIKIGISAMIPGLAFVAIKMIFYNIGISKFTNPKRSMQRFRIVGGLACSYSECTDEHTSASEISPHINGAHHETFRQ